MRAKMSNILPNLNRLSSLYKKYQKTYDIKFCDLNEIDDVVEFIDQYWKKGHILVQSRELMDWQHKDNVNNRYNFVLARHRESGKIHAILGYITTQFFDPKIKNILLWGAIWKTRDDMNASGLGIMLYYHLKINIDIETICISGISEEAKNNYKSLGFTVGRENQYFFANPTTDTFYLAKGIEKYQKKNLSNSENWTIKELSHSDYEDLDKNAEYFTYNNLYKSKEYHKNRYLLHPIYKYHFYAILYKSTIKALMILRESPANGGICIRLVEYIGDYAFLTNVKGSINELLIKNNYEYIDLVVTGIEDSILNKAGFTNIRSDSSVIIPNYFEPYLARNIDIGYAYTSTNANLHLIITKGDADQDRPSILN